MRDFLGNKLEVGDDILVIMAHGKNAGGSFTRGRVLRLTEHNVFFHGSDYTGYNVKERKAQGSKCILYHPRTAYVKEDQCSVTKT